MARIFRCVGALYRRKGCGRTETVSLDADQPRVSVPAWVRVRHYWGLPRTETRLHRLLSEFRFTSVGENLAEMAYGYAHPCGDDTEERVSPDGRSPTRA